MPTRHEELFAAFAEELGEAKVVAELWWDGLIDAEEERTGDREQAVSNVTRRWRVGPASHPVVIAVLRKYYLACHALNDDLHDDEEEVYPNLFVTEYLLEGETTHLAEFVGVLTYFPIGLDKDFEPV